MTGRIVLLLLASALLGGLFLLLRPVPPSSSPQSRTIDLTIQGRRMTPSEVVVSEGDSVVLRLTSDRDARVHFHGYDIQQDVTPSAPGTIAFQATLTGRFEIEDAITEAMLGSLVVQPK